MGASPPPSDPVRGLPTRRWWALALAAILLVVVLVIAGTLFFPLPRSGRSAVGPGHLLGPDPDNASFLEDRSPANAFAANLTGGPYQLVGGMALTSDRGATLPLDASGAFSCPLIPRPYPSLAAVEMPKVAGVTGGGLAPVWTFDYLGPGGIGVRIAVSDGKPVALGSIMFSSPACPSAERPTVNISGPYDSSSIGLVALNLGGGTFLAQNPTAEVTYSIAPGIEPGVRGTVAEEWNVTFDACGGTTASGLSTTLGSSLTYLFDADSGTLESTASRIYTCPEGADAPIPYALQQALQVNAPVVMILGSTALYNTTIAAACCGLTFGNLSIDLELPGGGVVPSGASLVVLNASGLQVCVLQGDELSGTAPDCPAPVAMGDLLSLRLPATGNGTTSLSLNGRWDFSGAVVVPLAEATPIPPA